MTKDIEIMYAKIDEKFENMSLEELDQYDTDQQARIQQIGVDEYINELKSSYDSK